MRVLAVSIAGTVAGKIIQPIYLIFVLLQIGAVLEGKLVTN